MTPKCSEKVNSNHPATTKHRTQQAMSHYSQHMSNLIPTPRTDKNGRTVIRHMKPEPTAKSASTIPPLTLNTTTDRNALILDITHAISAAQTPFQLSQHPKAEIIKALKPFTNTTLEKIQQFKWNAEKSNTFTFGIRNSWDETKTNDYLAVSEALSQEEPDGVPIEHYTTWGVYTELHPANNEGDYPEERLSQLLAIYHVINDMFQQDEYADEWAEVDGDFDEPYLARTPFRDFLLNPGPDYNRDDVLRIITTHHTYDPDRIKAMINLNNPSISGGIL